MYLLFGVVVVDNWYLHKIQNRYPQHYPTYHLVYQGSGISAGDFSQPVTVNTGETIILHVFRISMFHHRLP